MTAPIPNSTPPVEVKTPDGLGPKLPAASVPLNPPPDGAEVSELSRSIAAALGTDQQRVEALRREVASGSYVVDPVKIAEKLVPSENQG